jgi:hypothetical protein
VSLIASIHSNMAPSRSSRTRWALLLALVVLLGCLVVPGGELYALKILQLYRH